MTEIKFSRFEALNKSGTSNESVTLEQGYEFIKNNPLKKDIIQARISGKKNTEKIYNLFQYGKNVKVNYYDYVKNSTGAITWSIDLKGKKRKKSELSDDNLTSYIYYDIDETDNLDYVIRFLVSEAYVVAAWRSFGLNGMGFLLKINGLTLKNYLTTWEHYKVLIEERFTQYTDGQHFLKLDKATKDFTRLNALSYDPDMYISTYSYEIDAIEPVAKEIVNNFNLNKDLYGLNEVSTLEYVLNKWYSNDDSINNSEGRLNYYFYRQYFSETNILGIEMEIALSYLEDKANEDKYNLLLGYRNIGTVSGFASQIYNSYGGQFGTFYENCINEIEGTIVDFNVLFVGTLKKQLDYISFLEAKLNINNFTRKNIKELTIAVKEKGIAKETFIEYLLNHSSNNTYIYLVHKIYSNPYFIYGVVVDNDKKKRLEQQIALINEKKEAGYNVHENVSGKVGDYLILDESNQYKMLYKYFVNTMQNGISKNYALTYIQENKVNENNIDLNDYYDWTFEVNAYLFGIKWEKKIIAEKTIAKNTYVLKDDQYLSDLNLQYCDKTIMWAYTGTGKTTNICSNISGKRIVLVPVIPLLESMENAHKASVFYGVKKNINPKRDLIICTYSSFPALFHILSTSPQYNIDDYSLHVDEAQNFITSSSEKFRAEDMLFILNHLNYFKKVVMWTGTYIKNIIPEFQDYEIIKVIKERLKYFSNVLYSDKPAATESLCNKDGLNIIYLQSKKMERELGTFKNYFIEKGWEEEKMLFLNNDNKTHPSFEHIIKKELIEEKYNLVFCTSLVAEGLNINNLNVSTLHFCTAESVYIMEQVVNRFRKTVPENIYTYQKYSDEVPDFYFDGILQYQKELVELTNEIKKITYKTQSKVLLDTLNNQVHMYLKSHNNYEINYLTIAHEAYLKELQYCNRDKEYMAELLKEYSWIYRGNIVVEETIDNATKKRLKNLRRNIKNDIFEKQVAIKTNIIENETIDQIKDSIKDENINVLALKSDLPDFEFQIRKNIVYLYRHMTLNDVWNVMEEWQNNIFNNLWYKKFSNQLRIEKQEREKYFDNRVDYHSLFAKELKNRYERWFKEDKKPSYLKQGLIALVNDIKTKVGDSPIDSFGDAKTLLSQFFCIEQVLDANKNIRYKLSCINGQSEEIEHYHMYKSLINSALNGNIPNNITKEFINRYTINFRKNLFACSKIDFLSPVSEAQTFKMLQYYCNLEHKGRGMYEIQDVSTYINEEKKELKRKKVVSLEIND